MGCVYCDPMIGDTKRDMPTHRKAGRGRVINKKGRVGGAEGVAMTGRIADSRKTDAHRYVSGWYLAMRNLSIIF